MTIRKARKLRNILMGLGFVIILLSGLDKVGLIIGFIVMLSCIIPDYLYNRCPNCNKLLGRHEGQFCIHCGAEVDVDICVKSE